ncbi:MAG: hypothetical protein CM15mP25_0700 [Gammaproteobacteria bacterium]|nr:MAG: hypothetical protein CM15mP25_0700 [Gammaproteobacteria bacterium]
MKIESSATDGGDADHTHGHGDARGFSRDLAAERYVDAGIDLPLCRTTTAVRAGGLCADYTCRPRGPRKAGAYDFGAVFDVVVDCRGFCRAVAVAWRHATAKDKSNYGSPGCAMASMC